MHKLLERQLRSATVQRGEGDFDAAQLVAIVNQTYHEFERERRLNDRAAKLMEEELREANKNAERQHDAVLHAILDNASDGMLVVGHDGIIEIANCRAESQFGAKAATLLGIDLRKLMGLAVDQHASGEAKKIGIQEGTGYRLDGRIFPVEFSVSPLETAQGTRYLWIVRDITERMRVQRELLETQLKFQDFAEASSDCFWELDATLSKASADSLRDAPLAELLAQVLTPGPSGKAPNGVAQQTWEMLHRHLHARQHFRDLNFSIERGHGRRQHLVLSGKPIIDIEGRLSGYRGTGRDITREIEAEEAANRAERRLVEAMEGSSSAIAIVDSAFKVIAGNSALRSLIPSRSEQLHPGRSFTDYLSIALGQRNPAHPDYISPSMLLRILIDKGEAREVILGGIWHLATARLLSDGGVVFTFSDISMLKTREKELAEAKVTAESANRLKSQFLATMSHELRTPLNAILGFSEVINKQTFGGTPHAWVKYTDYALSIHESGRHLLALISEILDLSKIEAGTYVLDFKPVDMRENALSALTIIEPVARKANITIERTLPKLSNPIAADERALRQITLNLLSNAVKFTHEGGKVSICLEEVDGHISLNVTDTGIGIPKEYLDTVFEAFRQVDSSLSRRHEGTGLGLAITKKLTELHKGTIELTSQVGVGTSVTLRFPVHAAETVESTTATSVAFV